MATASWPTCSPGLISWYLQACAEVFACILLDAADPETAERCCNDRAEDRAEGRRDPIHSASVVQAFVLHLWLFDLWQCFQMQNTQLFKAFTEWLWSPPLSALSLQSSQIHGEPCFCQAFSNICKMVCCTRKQQTGCCHVAWLLLQQTRCDQGSCFKVFVSRWIRFALSATCPAFT